MFRMDETTSLIDLLSVLKTGGLKNHFPYPCFYLRIRGRLVGAKRAMGQEISVGHQFLAVQLRKAVHLFWVS